jgi:hypothetical protein
MKVIDVSHCVGLSIQKYNQLYHRHINSTFLKSPYDLVIAYHIDNFVRLDTMETLLIVVACVSMAETAIAEAPPRDEKCCLSPCKIDSLTIGEINVAGDDVQHFGLFDEFFCLVKYKRIGPRLPVPRVAGVRTEIE